MKVVTSNNSSGRAVWLEALLRTQAPGWSILVRLLVGLVVFYPKEFRSWPSLIFWVPGALFISAFRHLK